MAQAVARPNFLDQMFAVASRVADRIDVSTNGRFSSMFDRSTSLSTTPGIFNTNPNFGVIHAVESTSTRDWTKSAAEFARFTIDEARERLASLIDGDYIIESFNDLIGYLKEASVSLESRIMQGKMINYLIDRKTNQAVPAAQVHPSLSYKNVMTLEMKGALRNLIGNNAPAEAFGSWQGMAMVISNSHANVGYTVNGREGFFGKSYDVATADVDENLAIIRKARQEGVELILPQKEGAEPGHLVAGMPILRKSKSLSAAEVDPALDHRSLSLAFGKGMIDLYEELAEKNQSNVMRSSGGEAPRVVSLDEFRKRYAAVAKTQEPVAEPEGFGFGEVEAAPSQQRSIGLKRGMDSLNSLAVWDFDENDEIPMDPRGLPEGEYKRVSYDGTFEGMTIVEAEGKLRHLDEERRPIIEAKKSNAYVDDEQNMDDSRSMRLR